MNDFICQLKYQTLLAIIKRCKPHLFYKLNIRPIKYFLVYICIIKSSNKIKVIILNTIKKKLVLIQ